MIYNLKKVIKILLFLSEDSKNLNISKIKGKARIHIVHPIITPHPFVPKFMSDIKTPRNNDTTLNNNE